MQKKKLVYISHPSGGLDENKIRIENYIRKLYANDQLFDMCCFVSPVHCYGFMYHDTEYFKGLSFCTDLLAHCNAMLLLGDYSSSVGCKQEKQICMDNHIPFVEIANIEQLDNLINNGLLIKMLENA